jgi:hypothetical protein
MASTSDVEWLEVKTFPHLDPFSRVPFTEDECKDLHAEYGKIYRWITNGPKGYIGNCDFFDQIFISFKKEDSSRQSKGILRFLQSYAAKEVSCDVPKSRAEQTKQLVQFAAICGNMVRTGIISDE